MQKLRGEGASLLGVADGHSSGWTASSQPLRQGEHLIRLDEAAELGVCGL